MKEEKLHIMGVFDDEEPLLEAFKALQKENIEISDVFTPFPVHEILERHGRKSNIVTLSWFFGFFAVLGVLSFLYYTAVIDWPLNFGGKPSSTFPSFIVVTIILTILSVTILSLFTFSVRAKLWPNIGKPIFHEEATDDKFVILFEKNKIDEMKVKQILNDHSVVAIIEK